MSSSNFPPYDQIEVKHLGHKYHRSDVSSFFVSRHMMLTSLVTGDDDLDHLVKTMNAKFLHCKLTISPFIINKHLGGENKTSCFILFSIK